MFHKLSYETNQIKNFIFLGLFKIIETHLETNLHW